MEQRPTSRAGVAQYITLGVMNSHFLVAAFTLWAGTVGAAPRPPPIEIRALSVHLLLTPSGEFSDDVTALPAFMSWNFVPTVQLSPTEQRFDSYLVKVRLASPSEALYKGRIGKIEVFGRLSKKVLFTSPVHNLYIGASGETVVARLVEGSACEPVMVAVSIGSSRTSKNIEFMCGE